MNETPLAGMRISGFLSAADLDDRSTRPARTFARLIGTGGHTLVWGGSDTGLMKAVADELRESGCDGALIFRGIDCSELVSCLLDEILGLGSGRVRVCWVLGMACSVWLFGLLAWSPVVVQE